MLNKNETGRAAGWRSALLFGLVLFIVSLACGPLGGTEEEEPATVETVTTAEEDAPAEENVPTAAPTEAPEEVTVSPTPEEPTAAPAADEELLPVLDLDTPDDAESYRVRMVLESTTTADDGTVSTDSFILEGAQNFVADEAIYTISGNLPGAAGDTLTTARIGESQFLVLPDGSCISYNLDADDITDVFFERDGLLFTSLDNMRRVLPNETINGVETRHYVFDEANVPSAGSAMVNLTAVSGDVYLAVDSDRVIRVAMTGRGTGFGVVDETDESEVSYQIDFFDFDQVGMIEIPEGCSLPSDVEYPVLDDARDLFSGAGIFTYNTGYTVDEAVAFYQDTLREQGWSGGENALAGTGTALLNFTRGDEEIVITIAPDQDGGRTSIAIVPSP